MKQNRLIWEIVETWFFESLNFTVFDMCSILLLDPFNILGT